MRDGLHESVRGEFAASVAVLGRWEAGGGWMMGMLCLTVNVREGLGMLVCTCMCIHLYNSVIATLLLLSVASVCHPQIDRVSLYMHAYKIHVLVWVNLSSYGIKQYELGSQHNE